MTLPPFVDLSVLLGIRAGAKVSLVNAPSGFLPRLQPLPPGVEFLARAHTGLDMILFFTRGKMDLVERLPSLARSMAFTGSLWVLFAPHPSAASISDALQEDFIRFAALEMGLVDNKRCYVDEAWTGLRLVWQRRSPRPDKPSSHTPVSA